MNEKHKSMYFMEFIGSFFIVFTINSCNGSDNSTPFDILGIALAFFIAVFLSASISGAHLNGAVTFIVFLKERETNINLDVSRYFFYFLAQIGGGISAGLFSWLLGLHITNPDVDGVSHGAAFILEALFCMLLCLCVKTMIEFRLSDPAITGLIIFGVIMVNLICIGAFTGGVINPSIGLSLITVNTLINGFSNLGLIWLYIPAPLIGAFIAHHLFNQYVEYYRKSELEKESLVDPTSVDPNFVKTITETA